MDLQNPPKSKKLVNALVRSYLGYRFKRMNEFMEDPIGVQNQVRDKLVRKARKTVWGQAHNFDSIRNYSDFKHQNPLQTYEDLFPFIQRMMLGEADVLWPGVTTQFSKSSGTTNDNSKYIPVPKENIDDCHIQGTWDCVTLFYNLQRNASLFLFKNILLPGSIEHYSEHSATQIGDISALMAFNMPSIGRAFYEPSLEIGLISNWEEKIEKTAQNLYHRNDISMFGGVPTWNILLFRRILELAGKDNLLEIWPNLQVYFHGGVGFEPYRSQFEALIPSPDFKYLEVYNASEGFFAIQNEFGTGDMLLLLDNGIYYEFMPLSELGSTNPIILSLSEVELGTDYALIISTNGGLWRYQLGDTIQFTSLLPFKIIISGRTKQFINVFGEELMVHNAEKAISETCQSLDCIITEYTVGPQFFSEKSKGAHHWVIEFEKAPKDLAEFATLLDTTIQKINSDYEAKRFKGMALEELHLTKVQPKTFYNWMKSKNKIGVQNKVPRLSNKRDYIDAIIEFAKTQE